MESTRWSLCVHWNTPSHTTETSFSPRTKCIAIKSTKLNKISRVLKKSLFFRLDLVLMELYLQWNTVKFTWLVRKLIWIGITPGFNDSTLEEKVKPSTKKHLTLYQKNSITASNFCMRIRKFKQISNVIFMHLSLVLVKIDSWESDGTFKSS